MSGPSKPKADKALSVVLNDSYRPRDVIDVFFTYDFASGDFPYARTGNFRRLPADADVAPCGGSVAQQIVTPDSTVWLVRGDGWTMQISRDVDGSGWAEACAITDDIAREVVASVLKQDDPPAPVVDRVTMGFWNLGCDGRPKRRRRQIAAPGWEEIRPNYAARVAGGLERLMALRDPGAGGRLVLLHGPPGTGKSTALRCLARAWRGWCQFEYVLDPDVMLRQSDYLLHVLVKSGGQASLSDDDEGDDESRWRLLLVEDCDEFIKADAKSAAGQSLSRLLNVTDGLLGEGLKVLVCITTNEPLTRLHPAITRPGRCLANLHVTAFSRSEAATWLGRAVPGRAEEMTLAELFRARGSAEQIEATPADRAHGLYL